MDVSQKHLRLPLPKIYRLPITGKIGMLLVYLIFFLLFLLVLAFALIVLSSLPNIGFALLAIFLCLIFPFILLGISLYMINQFRLRLELHSQGVLYSALGQRLHAPCRIKQFGLRFNAINGTIINLPVSMLSLDRPVREIVQMVSDGYTHELNP